MQKELSLVKTNRFSDFFNKIKSFFTKSNKKMEEIKTISPAKEIDDFEYLRGIIEGKIQIKDLDKELKKRLIKLCNTRLAEVNKEIEKIDAQIEKLKNN